MSFHNILNYFTNQFLNFILSFIVFIECYSLLSRKITSNKLNINNRNIQKESLLLIIAQKTIFELLLLKSKSNQEKK